jgi:hypothetical protein
VSLIPERIDRDLLIRIIDIMPFFSVFGTGMAIDGQGGLPSRKRDLNEELDDMALRARQFWYHGDVLIL